MTDTAAVSTSFERVGTGLTVYESPDPVIGRCKWLETPQDVIDFASGDDVSDVIVVSRGGATTFLTMALNAGVRGVVTLQGAPESHLGIVCREYGIPCVMSVSFDKGVRTSRGETVPADGAQLRLDVSSRPEGHVDVEVGAPTDDSPPPESAGPAMSEEQMAQIMALLEKFGGVVPHGSEGDEQMRAEMTTRVLYADPEIARRELTVAEVNEAVRYYTWNEWDALAARATEGESGLIPRQEYEAMGIMNCWFKHPEWLQAIEDRVGIDGVIDIGGIGHREIGTKLNMLHVWAMATAPSFGRGIAIELNLHDVDYRADRIRQAFSTVHRLYHGLWREGPTLTSMMNYRAEILDTDWIERFTADRISLADDQDRSTFLRFNGSAELLAFLLHFDNRLGVGDHGPYPLPDGGFVLVRDIFLNEPAFPWSDATDGLPHAVTVAMFFPPDSGLQARVNDISTVFTTPSNYLPFVDGVAVYERAAWDTPVEQIRTLELAEMAELRQRCEDNATALYARIAAMSKREKIEAGAMTYTAGFVLPVARAAGMYDELVAEQDFLGIHPAVAACYETIIGGVATEMIPRLFLTGSWGNPVPEQESAELASDQTEFRVLHAIAVRGMADADQIAESTGLDPAAVSSTLAATTERGHTKERTGRIKGFTLTPAGRARHIMLRGNVVTKVEEAVIAAAYEQFLVPNAAFKQLTTDFQTGGDDATSAKLDAVHAQVVAVLGEAAKARPDLARYGERLDAARARFAGGDRDALAKPLSGSYHDVWMELHEDLLVTLGRERTDEDGA